MSEKAGDSKDPAGGGPARGLRPRLALVLARVSAAVLHHRWRHPRFLAAAAGVLVLTGLAIALFVRLLGEPVYTPLGATMVADRLKAAVPELQSAEIGEIGFGLSGNLEPVVAARDITVRLADGSTGSLDTVVVTLAWGGLFSGQARVSSLVADHVALALQSSPFSIASFAALLPGIGLAPARARLTDVGYAEIGSLSITNDGVPQIASGTVTLAAPEAGVRELRLAAGTYEHPWSMLARYEFAGKTPHLHLSTSGLDLAALPGSEASPSFPSPFSGALDFDVDVSFAANGDPVSAFAGCDIGPVRALGDDASSTEVIGRSHLTAVWDGRQKTVSFGPSPIAVGTGQVTMFGGITGVDAAAAAMPFNITLHAASVPFAGRQVDASTLLAGRIDPGASRVSLDDLRISLPGVTFLGSGSLDLAGASPHSALRLQSAALSVDALKAFWPQFVAAKARHWVDTHLHSGVVRNLAIELDSDPAHFDTATEINRDPDGMATRLDFDFSDADFLAYEDGPTIVEGAGHGHFGPVAFTLGVATGRVRIDDGHMLDISSSTLSLPSPRDERNPAEIHLHLGGDAAAAATYVAALPGGTALLAGVRPDGVSGKVTADVAVNLPAVSDVSEDEIVYSASVSVEGLALADPFNGHRIDRTDLAIHIADRAARVTGRARVDDVPVSVDFVRPLAAAAGAVRSSNFHLVVDVDERKKLGLDFDFVTGPIDVTVTEGADAPGNRRKVRLDLSAAAIAFNAIGLEKPAGMPAILTFDLLNGADGGHRIENATIDCERIAFSGASLVLDAKGGLAGADFPKVRLRPGDDVRVQASRDGDGMLEITASGNSFDGRSLIDHALATGKAQGVSSLVAERVRLTLARLQGYGNETLTGVAGSFEIAAGHLRQMQLHGTAGGGGDVTLEIAVEGDHRKVTADLAEGGRYLRFLNIYTHITEGSGHLTGSLDDDGRLDATTSWRKVKIEGEPALAKVQNQASLGKADASRVELTSATAAFSYLHGVVTLRDCVLRTQTTGAILSGTVDFAHRIVRLTGTYLPATNIDGLFSWVPILGQTVQNNGRSGLFGVTFRLTGPFSHPEISVNPLSLIAPGIFRQVFEMH